MKKTSTSILLITSSLIVFGQKAHISWGEESKTETIFNSFVKGQDNSMVKLSFQPVSKNYFYGKAEVRPILTIYDDKLAEVTSRDFTVNDKNVNFNTLLSIKNKLYMFTSIYDKDAKSTTYSTQPLDIDNLNAVGGPIVLGTFDAINKRSTTTVGYSFSKDSSKILMFGEAPHSKKENQKYYIGVYDTDMKKLWERSVELPYKDKFVDILDHVVTNDGKVGVIIKHYDQEVKKEAVTTNGAKVPAYKTKFLYYDQANEAPTEFVLDFNDKFVHKLEVTDDNDRELTFFGLYKTKNNGNVAGFFVATMDKQSNRVATTKQSPFSTELMDQLRKDKQGSNSERDPGLGTEFALAQTITRNDGSKDYLLEYNIASLMYESNFGTPQYNMDKSPYSKMVGYWYYSDGDIIDVSLKTNGSVVIARLPKMQNSRDTRRFSTFKALVYDDKLAVFYNDNHKNMERDINKKPDDVGLPNDCVLTMAVIDAKGNVTRTVLQENKNKKGIPAIKECTILGNNKIGLYAQKQAALFSPAKDMVGILELE